MTARLFVDTSAWFAFANRVDPDHDSVSDVLKSHEGRLVTSNFIFDETVTLCAYRLGHDAAVRVGGLLLDPRSVDTIRAIPADETEAWQLFRRRSDKGYSYTDCVSFAMMKRLHVDRAAALDEDFRREGFEVLP